MMYLKSSNFTSRRKMIGWAGSHCLSSYSVYNSKNRVLTWMTGSTLSICLRIKLR